MREVTDPQILAQLNAPEETQGYKEVTDPQILAQLNAPEDAVDNVPRGTSDNSSFMGDVGKHALAGLASFGRDVINIPPSIGKIFGANMPFYNQNYDYYKSLGVNENLGDKIAVGAAGFVPFLGAASKLSKASSLAENLPRLAPYIENAGAAGAQGALLTSNDHPIESGAMSALFSVPGSMAGQLGNVALQYGAKKYAQSAIPAFTKKVTDYFRSMPSVSDYSAKLFGKFSGAVKENNDNWNTLGNTVSQLDTGASKEFNNQPYHDYIDSYLSKIDNMDPAQKAQYQQSVALAQHAKEIAPKSFSGTVASRQNINSVLSDFLDPTGMTKPDRYSKEFITGLKDNLKNELLEANKGNVDPELFNQFKSHWEDANQSHQNLQNFYQSQQPTTGRISPVKQTREMYQDARNTGALDPSIFNKYAPPLTLKGAQGTQGFDHLSNLYGNPQTAQEAIQASLFRRPVQQGATTIDSAKIYSDMSPAQRQAILGNSSQGQMLDAINNTRLAFGREPEKTLAKIGHGVMSVGIPGLAGFGVGMASGDSWDKSLLLGGATAAASKGLGKIAGRTATPQSVARAIRLSKSNPLTGSYLNPFLQTLNPATGGR